MTAQTTDFSGLLYYNPAGPGFDPVPQVTIHCPDSMNEGDSITVDLVTWGIPDGTVLRHVFPLYGTNFTGSRFNVSPISPVSNNRASFFIEVSADHTTSLDGQSFDIVIKKTLTGPALATKYGVNVNDTSLTPSKPTGLIRKTYSGYFYTGAEASQWFKDKTPIDTLTGAPLGDGDPAPVHTQYQSYEWVGYFSPPATDDYTFYVNSDDYTLVWIGSNAVSAYTNSNADIACATSQFAQSSAISLTSGDFVPIRIQFGNNTGGGELHVSWSSTQHPTPTRNFDWLIYHDAEVVPTYELTTQDSVTSIDEGAALTFNVTTTNVADGTVLTWTTDRNPTDTGGYPIAANRFNPADSGSVTINNNTGTFTVTVSADSFTAPLPQLYNIVVAGSNTVLITVNDTSQTPTYSLAKAGNVSSINEGTALTFNVTTTNVADGTTLYFYVGSTGASAITAGRFSQGSGSSFTVTGNSGTFDITVSADSTTATGTQSYEVKLSTTLSPPTFVGSAVSVTVNDTSQDPPPSPVSFLFNGSSQYIEVQGSTTDWNLVNGTIEFWIKATTASTGPRAIMAQRPSVGVDIFLEGGYLKVPDTSNGYIQWTEPTPGIWTHVAIVSLSGDTYVFYNGVYQGHQTGQAWANTSDTIYIGRRQGAFQYFDGKLYGIRITNSNLYVDPLNVVNFNPYATVLPPAKVSYTTLLLNPTDYAGLVDLSDSHHTLNAFASKDDDQPAGTGRHTLRVTTPNNGTSAGSAYFTISNYPAVASIPVGATVQSDVFANSQISFLVMSRVWPFGGGGNLWQVSYDPIPGGTRATVPGDSFTFTW